jgi:hypothetical protein
MKMTMGYWLFAAGLLAACTNFVEPKAGAERLVKLKAEPAGCRFLYELDADANFYGEDDAERYVENRIAEKSGNAYWIKSKEKKQNEWKPFAPEYSYAIVANVYECGQPAADGRRPAADLPLAADGASLL